MRYYLVLCFILLNSACQASIETQPYRFNLQKMFSLIKLEPLSEEEHGRLVEEGSHDISFCDAEHYVHMLEFLEQNISKTNLPCKPEIHHYFLDTCNALKDINEFKPHHIRILRKKILTFHGFLKRFYHKNEHILTPREAQLIQQLKTFMHGMLVDVLQEENFDFSFSDYAFDIFWHEPLEFISEHRLIITSIAVVALLGIAIYYLYPEACKYLEWRKLKELKKMTFKNLNTNNIEVHQFVSFPQSGATCGPHALWNVIHANNVDSRLNKQELEAFLATLGETTWLEGGELAKVAGKEGVPCVSIVPDMGTLQTPDLIGLLEVNGDPRARFIASHDGHCEYFLVNTGARGTNTNSREYAHWFTVCAERFASAPGGVRMWVADSLQNTNRTNHPAVTNLHRHLSALLAPAVSPAA